MADNLTENLRLLLDEREIHRCHLRINRASDRCDRELFLSGFHADAVIATGPFVGNPEELYAWSSRFQRETYIATFHKLLNHYCNIDDSTAHAKTYFLFVGCLDEKSTLLAGGRYIDRFECRAGRWGLAMRNNFVEWTSTVPALASPLGDALDLELNGLPSLDRRDPSYARPLANRRALSNFQAV